MLEHCAGMFVTQKTAQTQSDAKAAGILRALVLATAPLLTQMPFSEGSAVNDCAAFCSNERST